LSSAVRVRAVAYASTARAAIAKATREQHDEDEINPYLLSHAEADREIARRRMT
jgi:hypothetical protein